MSGFNLKRVMAQQQAPSVENEGLVLDEHGKPKQLFHGTTHDFEAFDPSLAHHENSMGKGIYLTDSPEDATSNYAGIGPDLESRIDQLTDRLMNDWASEHDTPQFNSPEYKRLRNRMRFKARKQLTGSHKGAIYPVQVRMKNPLVLDPKSQLRYDSMYDYPEGEDGQPNYDSDPEDNQASLSYRLWKAILNTSAEMGVDGQKIFNELDEATGISSGEPRVYDVDRALRDNILGMLEDPDNGDLIGHEFIRRVYQKMGFDGVVMDAYSYFGPQKRKGPYGNAWVSKGMNIAPGTKHYVLFDPKNVKSIYNPKPNWNDPRLTSTAMRRLAASMAQIVKDPAKYGYEKCPDCDGRWANVPVGSLPRGSKCKTCNGWGVLPRQQKEEPNGILEVTRTAQTNSPNDTQVKVQFCSQCGSARVENADGNIPCKNCNGRGEFPDHNTCVKCNGTKIEPGDRKRCSNCGATRDTVHHTPSFRYQVVAGPSSTDIYIHTNTDDTAKTLQILWGTESYGSLIAKDTSTGSQKDLTDLAKDGAWGNEMRGELRFETPNVQYVSQAKRRAIEDQKRKENFTETFGLSQEDLGKLQEQLRPKKTTPRNVF